MPEALFSVRVGPGTGKEPVASSRLRTRRPGSTGPGAPDWADYVDSGFFKANNDTIQAINRYEFTPNMTRIGTGELDPRLFPKAMWRQVLGEAADEIETLGYPPPEGLPELREAIAAKTLRDSGLEVAASQVIVTNGGKQAVYQAFQTLLDPGVFVRVHRGTIVRRDQIGTLATVGDGSYRLTAPAGPRAICFDGTDGRRAK